MNEKSTQTTITVKIDWQDGLPLLLLPPEAVSALGIDKNERELTLIVEGRTPRVTRIGRPIHDLANVLARMTPEDLADLQRVSKRYAIDPRLWGAEVAEISDPHTGGYRYIKVLHEISIKKPEPEIAGGRPAPGKPQRKGDD